MRQSVEKSAHPTRHGWLRQETFWHGPSKKHGTRDRTEIIGSERLQHTTKQAALDSRLLQTTVKNRFQTRAARIPAQKLLRLKLQIGKRQRSLELSLNFCRIDLPLFAISDRRHFSQIGPINQ